MKLKPGVNKHSEPNFTLTVLHIIHGDRHFGLQSRWKNAHYKFFIHRTYYDGWWYGLNVWPFWIAIHY